ncbi:hypothetical protein BSL78_25381 [Apostichopus japonicus]|uniref:Alkylated DNA repair protein AlkB homologue 8 N-terminal domain-containing protein n=1 Tax=Stichopus japonicus TaxID=307972 RepID=A0A2G8JPX4_STIJA|nr:hypothetical protein BSL78_25381 [Apostichopus japonicus]
MDSDCSVIKYADDTVITGYLSDDIDSYATTIARFVQWCDDHLLQLNVSKTKELIIDFRCKSVTHAPIYVHGEQVEQVDKYKYLGTMLSNNIDWSSNATIVHKKANQRLYFLRKLKNLRVDKTIMTLFYKSLIQSVLMYNIICYFANGIKIDVKMLEQSRKVAQRVIGAQLPSLEYLYHERVCNKLKHIMQDPTHPLFQHYNYNRSGLRLCPPRTLRAATDAHLCLTLSIYLIHK